MSGDPFENFKAVVGPLFAESADPTRLAHLKRALGKVFFEKIDEIAPERKRKPARRKVFEFALNLCGITAGRHEDLPKMLTNYRGGTGLTEYALALYYLSFRLADFETICEELDEALMPDPEGIWENVELVERDYTLEEIIEGRAEPRRRTLTIFADQHHGDHLPFTNTPVPVLGRDLELQALRSFLDGPHRFRWMQLAGTAGQGKSRLALELTREVIGKGWDAGFITDEVVRDRHGDWATWQPDKPTLIIIDNVRGREAQTAIALRALAGRKDLKATLRLLLLERQAWHDGESSVASLRTSGSQAGVRRGYEPGFSSWFVEACGGLPISPDILASAHENNPITLGPLGEEDLVGLVRSVAGKAGDVINMTDDAITQIAHRVDGLSSPLFAYFIASELGAGADGPDLTREATLTSVLQRESSERWSRIFEGGAPMLDSHEPGLQIARFATMVGGCDFATASSAFDVSTVLPGNTSAQAAFVTGSPQARDAHTATNLKAMEPDLLGEWFVLWGFEKNPHTMAKLVQAAWEFAPYKMAAFVLRCFEDFPFHRWTRMLLDVKPAGDIALARYVATHEVALSRALHLHFAFLEGTWSYRNITSDPFRSTLWKFIRARLNAECVESIYEDQIVEYVVNLRSEVLDAFCELSPARIRERDRESLFALSLRHHHFILNPEDRSRGERQVSLETVRMLERFMWDRETYKLADLSEFVGDPREVIEYCQMAADEGLPAAMFNMGIYYKYGLFVAKDTARAKLWFERAIEAYKSYIGFDMVPHQQSVLFEPDSGRLKPGAWFSRPAM